jgi:hypothetical protein
MNTPIQTYDDLLKRKKQLETLLEAQKELIKVDIEEIKESLIPFRNAAANVVSFFTRDKAAGLLGLGANSLIDVFVKKVLLSRSGWITKLVIPFFIKNFSSHFIAERKDSWMKNIKQWFSSNGHDKEKKESESETPDY